MEVDVRPRPRRVKAAPDRLPKLPESGEEETGGEEEIGVSCSVRYRVCLE